MTAKQRLEPAKSVIDHSRQPHDEQQAAEKTEQLAQHGAWRVAALQPLHARFDGGQVNYVEQRDIGNHRRQKGVADDIGVGHPYIFHHQKGRCAHHRRHQLTVHRGGDFHRTGLIAAETDPFHHRNGEGTGSDRVGDG